MTFKNKIEKCADSNFVVKFEKQYAVTIQITGTMKSGIIKLTEVATKEHIIQVFSKYM